MTLRSTVRCGSVDPKHRVAGCRPCKKAYNRAYRGEPDPRPGCRFCHIARDNGIGARVYQYPIIRSVYLGGGRRTNKVIASISICDDCLIANTIPSPSYAKAHGLSERQWPHSSPRSMEDGLRSHEGTASNLQALAS